MPNNDTDSCLARRLALVNVLLIAGASLAGVGCGRPALEEQPTTTLVRQALGTHALTGTVFGNGSPLSGVLIEALADGTSNLVGSATTGADGRYQIALEAGSYNLRVTAPAESGFPVTLLDVAMPDADAQHDVVLVPPAPASFLFRGRVSGYLGAPAVSAEVVVQGGSFARSTQTDADGRYEITIPSGADRYEVRAGFSVVFGNGGGSTNASTTVTPSGEATMVVDLPFPLVRVYGRVLDPSGNPVPFTSIEGSSDSIAGGISARSHSQFSSNELGEYEALLAAGTEASFRVDPPRDSGLAAVTHQGVTLNGETLLDFVAPAGSLVQGQVLGAGGAPIPNLQMVFGPQQVGTNTDENGHYQVVLSDGTYQLNLSGGTGPLSFGFNLREVTVAGTTTLDVTVPVVRVHGTVRDSSGALLAGAEVRVNTDHDQAASYGNSVTGGTTDAEGRFDLLSLPGTASILVQHPSGRPHHGVVVAVAAGNPPLDIVLAPIHTLRGRLTDWQGQPVAGAIMVANRSSWGDLNQNAITDDNGDYEMPLFVGQYSLQVFSGPGDSRLPVNWNRNLGDLTITGDLVQNVTLPRPARVLGRVLDSNEVAVPGVEILAFSRGSDYDSFSIVRTDQDGAYELVLWKTTPGNEALFFYRPDSQSGFLDSDLFGVTLQNDLNQHVVLQLPDVTAPVIVAAPTVAHLSDTSLTLTWTTNEPADSTVEFGTSAALGTTVTRPELVTTHLVTLTGLTPATTYSFRVRSSDASGNSVQADGNPTDTQPLIGLAAARLATMAAAPALSFRTQPVPGDVTAPVITRAPAVVFRDRDSAIISWGTDEPASSLVNYGTSALGSSLAGPAGLFVRDHVLRLTGLLANTNYQARVTARDPDGNGPTLSGIVTFTTTTAPDTQPPVVTVGPTAVALGTDRVLVTWTTDEPATTGISYNDGRLFQLSSDPALVTEHAVVLAGLLADTDYFVTVSAKDPAGNGPTVRGPITVRTAATADQSAPTLTTPVASGITLTTAVVTWTTNEDATSQVAYGLSAGAADAVQTDATLRRQHRVLLTGLRPGTTYFLRASSADATGNGGAAPQVSFRTVAPDSDGDGIPDDVDRCPTQPGGPTDTDRDGCPNELELSISDAQVTEADSGSKTVELRVTLNRAGTRAVTVKYATADGTAKDPADYSKATGQLSFPVGTTSQKFVLTIKNDTIYESNETFLVKLNSPVGAKVADGEGVVTITNNDAVPTLSISNASVEEGNSGQKNATFTVTASRPSEVPVQFRFATANGTASAPGDYAARSGVVAFVTITSVSLSVPINGDKSKEANETFTMTLSEPVNATIIRATGTMTITNDDR